MKSIQEDDAKTLKTPTWKPFSYQIKRATKDA